MVFVAVSAYDKNHNLFIRPSDFPLFVVQRLSELDPDLKKLLHNSYVAIVKGAGDGFVADELQFNADGNLVIKKNTIGAADALNSDQGCRKHLLQNAIRCPTVF